MHRKAVLPEGRLCLLLHVVGRLAMPCKSGILRMDGAAMTFAGEFHLWHGLRDWPWDESDVPRPLTPHPAPAVRGTVGNWLEELDITTWPPAPDGWRLTQLYAVGHGVHASRGTPTRLIRSLVLAYFHRTSARGATAILHYKPAARKNGEGSWLFAEGLTWCICTDEDCERIRPHTADLPKAAGAEEIKKLLTEGI